MVAGQMVRKVPRVLAAALALVLVVPPAANAKPAEACADIYPSMALGPLPPEAETTPFFYGSEETASGSFSVHFTGIDCGYRLETTAAYSGTPGSAGAADYSLPSGRTQPVCGTPQPGCPNQQSIPVALSVDGEVEPVVESFTISLRDPQVNNQAYLTALSPPSNAPFLIVDDDGSTRVAFDDLTYSRSESHATMTVPVWRAGPLGVPVTVPYSVGPGPGTSATANEDYTVTSPNPLVFGASDPVEVIALSIVNDKMTEPEETVQIALQGPAVSPNTKVVTIQDNEESERPTSRLHHPRHKWRYKKSDYRIREVHVFTKDTGGSGVTASQLALRRNMKNGDCRWLTNKGWQKKDCSNREWLHMHYEPTGDLWLHRVRQLKSSVGTKIKNYTAFSRAIDGAGNIEKDFAKKRNANTFEVKRARNR
jgi:hypothetical protein